MAIALLIYSAPGACGDLLPEISDVHQLSRAGNAFTPTGDDPWVSFRVEPPIDPGPADVVILDLRVGSARSDLTVAELFASGQPDRGWSGRRSLRLTIAPDGAWHRYRVPLGALGKARVGGIRFDPPPVGDRFELGAVRIDAAPSKGDPSDITWAGDDLLKEWLPGPGLTLGEDGAYAVTGPGAFLLSPQFVEVDAGRATQCEVQMAILDAPSVPPGRLCYGPDPGAGDTGCVAIPAVEGGRSTTHYLDMLLRPGWHGTIRRLRLEPIGPGSVTIGSRVRVGRIRTVPLHADPLTSIFVRRAEFVRAHNPTHLLALVLALLGAFLFVATAVVERLTPARRQRVLEPRRGSSRRGAMLRGLPKPSAPTPARGPRPLLEACSLASVLAFLVGMAVFPFESYPLLKTGFIHGDIDLPGVLLLFAAWAGFTRRLFYVERPTALAAIERPVLAFLVAILLASHLSLMPAESYAFFERHYLMFSAALLAGIWAPMGPRAFRTTLWVVLGVTLFMATIGVVQALGFKDFLYGDYFRAFQAHFYHANIRPKAFSTIGHQVPLATILLVLCPVCLYTAVRASGRLRAVGSAAAAVGFACFLLCMSRGAYLAFALTLPVLAWMVPATKRRRVAAAALVVAAVAAVIMVARRPHGEIRALTKDEGAPSIWSADEGESIFLAQRLLGARIALGIARSHPLLGSGPGTMRDLYDRYLPPGVLKRNPIWSTADDAYLTLLAETGLLGLATFVWLLAGLARYFVVVRRHRADGDDGPLAAALLASLVGFAAHLLVYDGLHWFTAPTMSAAVIGLLVASLNAMGEQRSGKDDPC